MSNLMYNYLHGTDINLYQRKDMFRNNTDTYLLGKFYELEDGNSLLDIGCNNGSLMLYSLDKNTKNNKLIGVDIQREAIELAEKNLELHNTDFKLYCSDINELDIAKVDVIVCNPPYFEYSENAKVKSNESLTIARFEKYCRLDDLCRNFRRLIKDTGYIYMVHRPTSLNRIAANLNTFGLAISKLQFVYAENTEHAVSVLMEIVVDNNTKTRVIKPLFLDY